MSRHPIAMLAALASLTVLAACGSNSADSTNVTLRDMEVVDGTANDAMADLDNATQEGTALENGAAAVTNNVSALANQSAALAPVQSKPAASSPAEQGVKKTGPGATE